MKSSSAVEVVWRIAAREAIAADWPAIEPDHFLIALFKFADLTDDQVREVASGPDEVARLLPDRTALFDACQQHEIDPAALRGEIRARIGKGGGSPPSGEMHRSAECRAMFDHAVDVAVNSGAHVLTPLHLLAALIRAGSFSPGVGEPVGDRVEPVRPAVHKGRDPNRAAEPDGASDQDPQRPERRALLRALAAGKSVALVAERSESVRGVVASLANAIARGDCPEAVKGRRIVEVEGAHGDLSKFMVGAGDGNPILFVPAMNASDHRKLVEDALAMSMQCLCHLGSRDLDGSLIRLKDRRHLQAMWIRETAQVEIPSEL